MIGPADKSPDAAAGNPSEPRIINPVEDLLSKVLEEQKETNRLLRSLLRQQESFGRWSAST